MWRIVSFFYEQLTVQEHLFIEKICNGEFLREDPDETMEYLINLVEKSHIWSEPSATKGISMSRPIRIYHLREEDNLNAHIENLTKQLEALKSQGGKGIHMVARVGESSCGLKFSFIALMNKRSKSPKKSRLWENPVLSYLHISCAKLHCKNMWSKDS